VRSYTARKTLGFSTQNNTSSLLQQLETPMVLAGFGNADWKQMQHGPVGW